MDQSAPEGHRGECHQHLTTPEVMSTQEALYLDEGPIFALRTFVEFLLFPIRDVEDPEGEGQKHYCHQLPVGLTVSLANLPPHPQRIKSAIVCGTNMEAEFYLTDTEHITVRLCSCQQVAVPHSY